LKLAPAWSLAVAPWRDCRASWEEDGALEVILSADDVSGDLAERYGYVNRSLPDADLDGLLMRLPPDRLLRQTDNHGYQAPSRRCQLAA